MTPAPNEATQSFQHADDQLYCDWVQEMRERGAMVTADVRDGVPVVMTIQ
ncbi:hypothetical protein [Chitinolyticbacter meiyuanensis]|nr:hypothetical protein [Chitinolyticbacter meiyuanensis]